MTLSRVMAAIAILSFVLISNSEAQNRNSSLVRQPRTMAMGGAGVGLADDEYALFHNPAGLAQVDDRRFKIVGVTAETSWDTYDMLGTSLDAITNFKIADLNKLMGKDISARLGYTPMIRLPNFAVAYIFDFQGSVNQFNQANPTFDLGYQTTHGVQAGWAMSFKEGKKSLDEFRLGAAVKVLWRRGGYYTLSTAGFLELSNQGKTYIDQLVGDYEMGFGADLGAQWVRQMDQTSQLSFGTSITDVLDTRFSDSRTAKVPMSMNLGWGYKKAFGGGIDLALAFDLRRLNQRGDFANKTHFGAELGIPLLDFYFGMNQLNATYGVAFDIWVLRATVASYSEEQGVLNGQSDSRKTLLQIDFNLPI